MTKNHIQSLVEQIANKGHGSAPFHQEKTHNQINELEKYENIQANEMEDDSAIRLRAYQIHLEKGGSDLDNWLEQRRQAP